VVVASWFRLNETEGDYRSLLLMSQKHGDDRNSALRRWADSQRHLNCREYLLADDCNGQQYGYRSGADRPVVGLGMGLVTATLMSSAPLAPALHEVPTICWSCLTGGQVPETAKAIFALVIAGPTNRSVIQRELCWQPRRLSTRSRSTWRGGMIQAVFATTPDALLSAHDGVFPGWSGFQRYRQFALAALHRHLPEPADGNRLPVVESR